MKKRYKIILAIIVIAGVLVAVKSCMNKVEPDLVMAYIGYDFTDKTMLEENGAELSEAVGDVNGDGQLKLEILEISFSENLSEGDFSNSQRKMASAVGGGTARLYFIDKNFLDKSKDSEVFADMSEFGTDGVKNSTGQVIAFDISDNERVREIGIKNTENLYLALRVVSEMDHIYDSDIDKKDEAARRAVRWILENK